MPRRIMPSRPTPGSGGTSSVEDCDVCNKQIWNWHDAVRTSGGKWIHKGCAPGADDE